MHQIALQEVELTTSGQFVCQITMDSPPFEFVEAGGQLTVISLPERFPVISGNKGHHHYALGDWVTLNCTCYDTFPAANIRWFINGKEVIYMESNFPTRFISAAPPPNVRRATPHSGAEMRYSGKNVFIVLNDTLKHCEQPREEIFEIQLLDQYENPIFKKVFSAFFHFYAKKSVTNFFAGQIVANRLLRGV